MLRADDLCSDGAESSAAPVAKPDVGLAWNDAVNYADSHQRVCGPLVTMRNDDDDVFLNLGLDYPEPERFTIVLWDVGWVEWLPSGTTLGASGTITLYNGVPQIELDDVGPVEVWD